MPNKQKRKIVQLAAHVTLSYYQEFNLNTFIIASDLSREESLFRVHFFLLYCEQNKVEIEKDWVFTVNVEFWRDTRRGCFAEQTEIVTTKPSIEYNTTVSLVAPKCPTLQICKTRAIANLDSMVQPSQEPIFVELEIMFLNLERGEIEIYNLNHTVLHHQIQNQNQEKIRTKKTDF